MRFPLVLFFLGFSLVGCADEYLDDVTTQSQYVGTFKKGQVFETKKELILDKTKASDEWFLLDPEHTDLGTGPKWSISDNPKKLPIGTRIEFIRAVAKRGEHIDRVHLYAKVKNGKKELSVVIDYLSKTANRREMTHWCYQGPNYDLIRLLE